MRLIHLAASLALLAAPAAYADDFTITGQGQTITFSLPDSPTPSSYYLGEGFNISNVDVDINGTTIVQDVGFGSSFSSVPILIGLSNSFSNNEIVSVLPYVFSYSRSAQVYSGPESNPTFILGSTNFLNFASSSPTGDYTLTITSDVTPTPEPSSIALLSTGVLGLAGMIRRRFVA